jgi:lipopolysaccharide transport protein LptA
VLIKSKTLTLDAKKRVFTYRDNVEIVRDDLNITANTVVGNYDENDEIKLITCEGNVVITRGPELRATSNRASYDVPRGVITMTEGPELTDKGNVLNADKVTIYVNEDRSEAEGNVRVKVIKASSGSPLSSGARKK